ncbi:unnamed protein product [Moneuplotes crassus]|uniref:Uncharacterized protein n=2 Tax=Euplotes crassus TaxID=5936 RepID=A0AAD1XNH5_EUPCR|nr:unnamed protein product [Moneuplotes crassus]
MTKVFKFIALLAFLAFVEAEISPQLESFRSPPNLRIEHNLVKYDRHMKYVVPAARSVGFLYNGLQEYNISFTEMLNFLNDLVSLILGIFHCESLNCLTPEYLLTKLFEEFRLFSRSWITELDYWYKEFIAKYAKKELGVINKIIATEGLAIYIEKSDCIRMRIGQYFMPTFVGNDTSNCSEYDQIIHSFSEQPVDPGIDWTSLCVKLTITLALAVMNYLCLELVLQEWKKTQELYQPQSNGIPLSQIENDDFSGESFPNSQQSLEESKEVTDSVSSEERRGHSRILDNQIAQGLPINAGFSSSHNSF